MQIVPGIVIGGKYEIERPLARGGMGAVWVARHVKLGQAVAVKFLDADVAAASGAVARFEREARAAAMLDTPHVVRVHDYGVEDGTPYLVMELLRGEDLNTRLRKRRRLSLPEAARILSQMGRALRRAHEAGIVHRDLKPANVYLAQVEDEEVVKILDFGIAKESWSRVEDATKTGEVFGSPHYMSPEQTRAQKTVDRRADVWATGVIAYRMITGRLPFPGDVLGEILSSVLVDPAPPMAEAAPDLPGELDGFFARALAKKKEERFSTVDELVEAFQGIAGGARGRPAVGAGAPVVPEATSARPSSPVAPLPPSPTTAAPAETLFTVGGPGTVDTSAATLPYRPAAAPRAPLLSGTSEAHTSGGATGPSITAATNSLLPPELSPRRNRALIVVLGSILCAVVAIIVVAVSVSSSEPEGVAGSAAAPVVAGPAVATATPTVRVEPGRPAETVAPSGSTAPPAASPARVTSSVPPAVASTGSAGNKGSGAPAASAKPTAAPAASPAKKPAAKPDSNKWGVF